VRDESGSSGSIAGTVSVQPRAAWRVAARPPDQLVAPTNGTSSGSSVAGSKTTNGMPFAVVSLVIRRVSRTSRAGQEWLTLMPEMRTSP
jgi:hypothetical protein